MGWIHTDPATGRKVKVADEQPKRALNAHAQPADGLFLAMELLSGDDGAGLTFDLTVAMGSGALVLTVTLPDGTRRQEVLDTQELVRTWVGIIKTQAESGNLAPLMYVYEDDGTPAPPPEKKG